MRTIGRLSRAVSEWYASVGFRSGRVPTVVVRLPVVTREVARIAMDHPEFVIKHINSPMSPEYMKYQLEHDTVHGRFDGTVEVEQRASRIRGEVFTMLGGSSTADRCGSILAGCVQVTDKGLMVNGLPITLSSTRDPTEIPWKDTGVRAAQWLARTRRAYIILQERYRKFEDHPQTPTWHRSAT